MVATWTQRQKIFLPQDILLLIIMYRVDVGKVIVHASNLVRFRTIA